MAAVDLRDLAAVVVAIGVWILIARLRPLTVERQIWIALIAVIIFAVVSCTYLATRGGP